MPVATHPTIPIPVQCIQYKIKSTADNISSRLIPPTHLPCRFESLHLEVSMSFPSWVWDLGEIKEWQL